MRKDIWQPDIEISEIIIEAYKNGKSAQQLGLQHNVADVTITAFLCRAGVKIRNLSDVRRKYTVNENAFDVITPEAAYWIGFILADGNVYKHPKHSDQLNIGLKQSDVNHLKKLKRFLGCNKPLYYNKDAVFFNIYSNKLINRLEQFGIIPRKSLIAKPPKSLIDNQDFWRGMIDGDGWIGWTTRGCPYVGLCGTFDIIMAFMKFVGKEMKIRYQNKMLCEIRYNSILALLVLRRLYDDAIISLDRKKKIFDQIDLWRPNERQYRYYGNLVYNCMNETV